MRILQRYILRELLLNFSFSLAVITSVFFVAVSVQTLYRFPEVGFFFVLKILPHFVPYSLAYTVPMSAMIGAVLTYGRLSSDNEITAMRTSGMHLYGILVPGFLLGLITVLICFVLQANVIPYCQYKKRTVTRDAVTRFLANLDSQQDVALVNFRMSWEHRDEQRRFHKLLITYSDHDGGPSQKFIAEWGRVFVEEDLLRFDLHGVQTLIDRAGTLPGDKSQAEAERRKRLEEQRADPPPRIDLESSGLIPGGNDVPLAHGLTASVGTTSPLGGKSFLDLAHLEWNLEIDALFPSSRDKRRLREYRLLDLMSMGKQETDEMRKAEIDTQVQQRFSLSFAGLSFVLIGMPLGVLFQKGNRLIAFFMSFLLVMILYYPLLMFGEAFAETNRLHPVPAMWSANLVLGGCGLAMILHVVRQ